MNKMGAIVVVFHPDATILKKKLSRLGDKVSIVVVDNTPGAAINVGQDNVTYIPLLANTGIANAQNEGIRYLLASGCSHIVFFDQDSDSDSGYVDAIVSEYDRITARFPNLFLLGPSVVDKDSNEQYKPLPGAESDDASFVVPRELISSGTCVSADRIRQVGLLKSSLFIDYVDFEWCWRAESRGLVCGMTRNVILLHKVGVRQKRVFGMVFIESAPFRYYYQYRNLLALCKLGYVPKAWKYKKLLRKALELLVLPAIFCNGRDILINSLHGIVAGLKFHLKN